MKRGTRDGDDSMKVLVLGGAGGMGQVAVREAVRFDFVESVTVADLHAEQRRRF